MSQFNPISLPTLLSLFLMLVEAASTQNINTSNKTEGTGVYEPGWVAGPHNRGTLSIVFSCFITLFLCIWTTVHVNIEPENKVNHTLSNALGAVFPTIKKKLNNYRDFGKFLAKSWIRKLGWGCVTLIVPEGALAIAAYERRMAHLLLDEVNKIIDGATVESAESAESTNPGAVAKAESARWDKSLAYYAVMGGFVIPEAIYDVVAKGGGNVVGQPIEALSKDIEHTESIERLEKPSSIGATGDDPAGRRSDDKTQILSRDRKAVEQLESSQVNKHLTLTPHGVLKVAKWEWETHRASGNQGERRKLLSVITPNEVRDKGNASALAKAIVFWQALWMVIQVISRTAAKLPVTLLELHTILHAFCAVAMYVTWWNKPLDIQTPTTIPFDPNNPLDRERVGRLLESPHEPNLADPLAEPHSTDPLAEKTPVFDTASEMENGGQASQATQTSAYLTSRAGLGKLMYQRLCGFDNELSYSGRISHAYTSLWSKGQHNLRAEALGISLVGLVYGGVHLAAWNNTFPSYAEQLLWKIAALITATAWSTFVISLRLIPVLERLAGRNRVFKRLFSKACAIAFVIGLFPVLLVRMYMLVEAVISIRRLPLKSYEIPTWSNLFPHAG